MTTVHELTLVAGDAAAFVETTATGSDVVLADTADLTTITTTSTAHSARAAPSVDFPHCYIGREITVELSRAQTILHGTLVYVDDDWLHIERAGETQHARRRKIVSMQVAADPAQTGASKAPNQVRYECRGITAGVNMLYVPMNKTLVRALYVQNNTSLTGAVMLHYVERPPVARPEITTYAEARAMPAALADDAAPAPPPPTPLRDTGRGEHSETASLQMRHGLNVAALSPLDIEFREEWIVQANAAPFLRFSAPTIDDAGAERFPFTGSFAVVDRPGRRATLSPWYSRTHLVADMPNDGSLTTWHGEHNQRMEQGRRIAERRFEVWNRSATPLTAQIRMPLKQTDSFVRYKATPDNELVQPVVGQEINIAGAVHAIADVKSQAEARAAAEKLAIDSSLRMTALVCPIAGINTDVGVVTIDVAPNTMLVVLYRVISRYAR